MYIKQFPIFIKIVFIDLFIIEIYALPTHSYTWLKKKCKNFFVVI